MKKCIVFTGGVPICCDNFVASDFKDCFVIVADSGCSQALRLRTVGIEISADVLLGDMDSFGKEEAKGLFPNAEFMEFPPEKDYTDTQLAIEIAERLGYSDIAVIGGTGNRADHYLANLALIRGYADKGIRVTINDGKNIISYCNTKDALIEKNGKFRYFSLIPDLTSLCGVTIKGAKYPLSDAMVDRDFPITVSNEITDEKCTISVREGNFFVILSSD